MIEDFENTEIYNNQGDLLGLDENDKQLMCKLRKVNPIKRRKIINKLSLPPISSKGSRLEFEKHFKELPKHIKEGLVNGDLRLADTVIYSIKPVNSKTIKMFETQDDREVGLRNISNAKLPKNQAMLVSGIYLLVTETSKGDKDTMLVSRYHQLEAVGAMANAEFSLKANKKIIVPESSTRLFNAGEFSDDPTGYYKLHNPRIIHDDVLIEFTVELGTMLDVPEGCALYVGLHGTITTP